MSTDPSAILRASRGGLKARAGGLQAHRLGCPACSLGRSIEGARLLARLESRAVAWWPSSSLASAAGCAPGEWFDHLEQFGINEAQAANLDGAAARALALALDGDTQAARVALSALDRLREVRGGAGPSSNGAGPVVEPGAPTATDWPGETGPD